MKILMKYIITIISSLFLVSCSLSLGGLVALDNSLAAGPNELDLTKLSELKKGTKVIIELPDSTIISGILKTYEEIITTKSKEVKIIVEIGDKETEIIVSDQVAKCTFIDEGGSVWTAMAIGAAIDAIIIYISSKSKRGLGTARIL